MQFPPSFLDEIRQRLRPSAVLGKELRLIPKGRGEFMALCPFHKEKTPSFSISDDKGFYHCFGCGAHGDVISFLMEHHKFTFPDAVTTLAGEAGLAMPEPETVQQKEVREKFDVYREIMDWAAAFYQGELKQPVGMEALHYLERRSLSAEVIAEFRLGFAPDSRTALKTHLIRRGVTVADMIEVGLLIQPEQGEAYDRFRGRVMFPILDAKGAVVAFGGRALQAEQQPKYLNSPETPIFKKGRMLYNFGRARAAAKTEGRMVIVEGYMDVIALYRAGIKTAVAPLGTALTEDQLQILWPVVNEPILCLDGDAAGLRAMQRAALMALPLLKPGLSLNAAFLPAGQDPDDLLNASGPEALSVLLSRTEPLAEMVWRFESGRTSLKTPEQRAALEKHMQQRVLAIQDKTVREHYQQFISEKIWELKRSTAYRPKKGGPAAQYQPKISHPVVAEGVSQRERLEKEMLALVIDIPTLLLYGEVEESFTLLEFIKADYTKLADAIHNWLETNDFYAAAVEAQAVLAQQLPEALAGQGWQAALKSLGTHRFLDKTGLAIADKRAIAAWRYLTAARNAELIKSEYETAVREWWETDPEKVEAFRKQKEQVEETVLHCRARLESALEQ